MSCKNTKLKKQSFILFLLFMIIISFFSGEIKIKDNMIRVKSGSFNMGDEIKETNLGRGLKEELPVHEVFITKDFKLSKYEVTNKQFCEVMNWAFEKKLVRIKRKIGYNIFDLSNFLVRYIFLQDRKTKLNFLEIEINQYVKPIDIEIVMGKIYPKTGRENHPVVHVTWYGAVAFCNYLSKMEKLEPVYNLSNWECDWSKNGYRLPTEAEWEYAAKGGIMSRRFKFSGSNIAKDVGWYEDNSQRDTHLCESLNPNELGFYNMSGNVMEWCWDYFSFYSDNIRYDPLGPDTGEEKVYKGGSWNFPILALIPSSRYSESPDYYNFNLGFRIARNVD